MSYGQRADSPWFGFQNARRRRLDVDHALGLVRRPGFQDQRVQKEVRDRKNRGGDGHTRGQTPVQLQAATHIEMEKRLFRTAYRKRANRNRCRHQIALDAAHRIPRLTKKLVHGIPTPTSAAAVITGLSRSTTYVAR